MTRRPPSHRPRPVWSPDAVVVLRREFTAAAPRRYIAEVLLVELCLSVSVDQITGGQDKYCKGLTRAKGKWVGPTIRVAKVQEVVTLPEVPEESLYLTMAPPPRPDNPVRRVPPGSFPAPRGGFTMLRTA